MLPVIIPIDSSSPRSVNIFNYGAGLYLITIQHDYGVSPTPVYTALLSIENYTTEKKLWGSSGETFDITGSYYSNNSNESKINIGGYSDSATYWSILTCRRLIKY